MPEINEQALVLIIQAVDAEIKRLRALPDEETVPDNEVRLVNIQPIGRFARFAVRSFQRRQESSSMRIVDGSTPR